MQLTDEQIEKGWRDTFSTNNPFCPCDLRTFTKVVGWAQHMYLAHLRVLVAEKEAYERHTPVAEPVYDTSVVARIATQMGWTPPEGAAEAQAAERAMSDARVSQIATVVKDVIETFMLWNGQASAGLDVNGLAGLRDELVALAASDSALRED